MQNPVIHVEVLGQNAGALQRFYADAFGWRFDNPSAHAFGQMSYRIAFPEESEKGIPIGIGGDTSDGSPDGVIFYVCVDDLPGSLLAVENLGGKVVRPPSQADSGGVRVALVKDPEGHLVGLVEAGSLPK